MFALLSKLRSETVYKMGMVQKFHAFYFNKVIEARIVSRFLEPRKGETLCDVACGVGRHSIQIARAGGQVIGIDQSKRNIGIATRCIRGQGCQFLIATAERLPFKSESFDKLVCVCSLEHFERDRVALEEMNRVLKEGGVLVLTVDSFTHEGIRGYKGIHRKLAFVVNYYSMSELKQKLEETGFTMSEYQYFVNSTVSTFFFSLGIRFKFGFLFKAVFPVAYIFSILADKGCGEKGKGCFLAVKASKTGSVGRQIP